MFGRGGVDLRERLFQSVDSVLFKDNALNFVLTEQISEIAVRDFMDGRPRKKDRVQKQHQRE